MNLYDDSKVENMMKGNGEESMNITLTIPEISLISFSGLILIPSVPIRALFPICIMASRRVFPFIRDAVVIRVIAFSTLVSTSAAGKKQKGNDYCYNSRKFLTCYK